MMKFLRRLAIAAALLAGVSLSIAAGTSATLSWTAPTAYTDGSLVQPGDIAYYTIQWTPKAGSNGPSGSLQTTGPVLSQVVPVPCGSVNFTVTVTSGANAKYPNSTSVPTNPIAYATGVSCAPNPPSGLAVQ